MTHLELQDKDLNLDALTVIEDETVFKVEAMAVRTYEKDVNVQMDISVEVNLDLEVLSRSGYTFIDVLSDIGGIQGLLITTIAIFLSFLNYKHFDTYMASQLFKLRIAEGRSAENISPTRFLNLYEYVVDLIPSCLLCCRKTRRWRGIDKARKVLDAELNIIDIVKSRRYFH